MAESAVVLLSGGIESATLLYMLRGRWALQPLFVDYGQRAVAPEARAARAQCERLGLELTVLDMAAVGEAFRARQTWQHHVPLPHRNLVLLSLGISYATQADAHRVCLGVNGEDRASDPTAHPDFLAGLDQLAARLGPVVIDAPLAGYDKAQIVALARDHSVDLSLTYSCLLGWEPPCGQCPQCIKRHHALKAE